MVGGVRRRPGPKLPGGPIIGPGMTRPVELEDLVIGEPCRIIGGCGIELRIAFEIRSPIPPRPPDWAFEDPGKLPMVKAAMNRASHEFAGKALQPLVAGRRDFLI